MKTHIRISSGQMSTPAGLRCTQIAENKGEIFERKFAGNLQTSAHTSNRLRVAAISDPCLNLGPSLLFTPKPFPERTLRANSNQKTTLAGHLGRKSLNLRNFSAKYGGVVQPIGCMCSKLS